MNQQKRPGIEVGGELRERGVSEVQGKWFSEGGSEVLCQPKLLK